MARDLPELDDLLRIIDAGGSRIEVRTACEVDDAGTRLPVLTVSFGSAAPGAPAVGFFGGVHGLERVGTHVLLTFLGSLVARLHWDETLHRQLEGVRLVFMPLVNPSGMRRRTRANGNGVNLMRNAPLQSAERVAFLLGGQRLTPLLPWYRGAAGGPMQAESAALCAVARAELLGRPFAIALDCHSGFGMRDRIWFPYAHTRAPFARLAEVHALKSRFEAIAPGHAYLFEPQCRQYLTHGDLWDHLCAEAASEARVFLPLTLEMGSWRWIRKSPRQILSRLGMFNPMPADRLERVRRNHVAWLDFLCRAAHSWSEWVPREQARAEHERSALAAWFPRMQQGAA